jgi:hypothetical protein
MMVWRIWCSDERVSMPPLAVDLFGRNRRDLLKYARTLVRQCLSGTTDQTPVKFEVTKVQLAKTSILNMAVACLNREHFATATEIETWAIDSGGHAARTSA